jgi:hypothetical protein
MKILLARSISCNMQRKKILVRYRNIRTLSEMFSGKNICLCVIHKVPLTVKNIYGVQCTYWAFRNLGVSNKCPSGSWCIIFWKESHVDVWCMGTVTKEGVKNSARANLYPIEKPPNYQYMALCVGTSRWKL